MKGKVRPVGRKLQVKAPFGFGDGETCVIGCELIEPVGVKQVRQRDNK